MFFGRILFLALLIAITATSLVAQRERTAKLTHPVEIDSKLWAFVEGKTIVSEVVFNGLDEQFDDDYYYLENPVYERDVVYDLRNGRCLIEPGVKLDLLSVEKSIMAIKGTLFEKGYFKANVTALGKKLPGNQMRLIFAIDRGPISRVSGIRFSGLKNFNSAELEAVMQSCLRDSWGKYDVKYIDYCAQKEARGFMYRNGYFQAKINGTRRKFAEDTVEIIFSVDEGIRYRIGDIKVVGSKVFGQTEILEMLALEKGNVADGLKLQDFIYNGLQRIYKDRGYITFNAEMDPRFRSPTLDGLNGVVDIDITIDEGPQFKINKIVYVGVKPDVERELLKECPLKPADMYSETSLKNYIKELNASGHYRFIDDGKQVDFQLNEKLGTVDISILLSPIAPEVP